MNFNPWHWLIVGLVMACPSHAEVTIRGAPKQVVEVVRSYLASANESCRADDPVDMSTLHRAVQRGLDALGYYASEFTVSVPEQCEFEVDLSLGARSAVSQWNIDLLDSARIDRKDQAWLVALAQTGQPFIPVEYERAKRDTISGLRARGYLDAEFVQSTVIVDPASGLANIQWTIQSGRQYLISEVRIEQTTLHDDRFRRLLDVKQDDPLRESAVESSYENLVASDYFSTVSVVPQYEERSDGQVPILVTAEAAKPWSVLSGLGFATDSGPRARLVANSRYLNKRGHRFGTSALVSPVTGHLNADYRWPGSDPRHEWYSFTTRYNYEHTETSDSETRALGLRRNNRLNSRWTHTLYTDLMSERFDISEQEGRSDLWLFGTNLTYTSLTEARRPRGGRSISVDLRGAHSALLSDSDVLQLQAHFKQIIPFVGNTRWLLRAEGGISWQDEFDNLPPSLRFFTGGDKTVRGFALDELGPEDDNGDVIGGARLLNFSAEFDIPVRENWSVALFSDWGSAFDDTPEFSQSVGVGVRWYSPIGPVRVDLAHPLQDSTQPVRLHISLGPDL